eukprot:Skav222122  [mRNA]  locus=scaffold1181:579882:580655:- [translate_table: standard]
MCKHWRAKRCRMGNDCNFAHSAEELREAPSLLATKLCFEFNAKGHCSKGHACTFAHGQDELRSMPVEAIRPAKRDQSGSKPMKIKARLAHVHSSNVQSMLDSLNPNVQKPAPIDACPKMEALQMKMNQLAALHSSLSLLRPPPGLEMEASRVQRLFDGSVADTDSLASTSYPSSPRDECGSEPKSPLMPFMPQRHDMIWL